MCARCSNISEAWRWRHIIRITQAQQQSDITVFLSWCVCVCVKLFCSKATSFNVAGKAKSLAYLKESKNRGNEQVYPRAVCQCSMLATPPELTPYYSHLHHSIHVCASFRSMTMRDRGRSVWIITGTLRVKDLKLTCLCHRSLKWILRCFMLFRFSSPHLKRAKIAHSHSFMMQSVTFA